MDQITVIIKCFNNDDKIIELEIDKAIAETSVDKTKYVLNEIWFLLNSNNKDSIKKFFDYVLQDNQ